MDFKEAVKRNSLNIGWGIIGLSAVGFVGLTAYEITHPLPPNNAVSNDYTFYCGVLPKLSPDLSTATVSIKPNHWYKLINPTAAGKKVKGYVEAGGCKYGARVIHPIGQVACSRNTAPSLPFGEFQFNCNFRVAADQVPTFPACPINPYVPPGSPNCIPTPIPSPKSS